VPRGWRTDPTFQRQVQRWQAQAVRMPVDQPQPGDWNEPLHADPTAAMRRIKQRLSQLIRVVAEPRDDLALLREHGIEPWVPPPEQAGQCAPMDEQSEEPRPRHVPPKRSAAPVTQRWKCPLCGGPHSRAEHPPP
jgi:hypothetical protein